MLVLARRNNLHPRFLTLQLVQRFNKFLAHLDEVAETFDRVCRGIHRLDSCTFFLPSKLLVTGDFAIASGLRNAR